MNYSITKLQKISICPNCHNVVTKQTGKEQYTPAHVIANNIVKCNVTNTTLNKAALLTPETREAQKQEMRHMYLTRRRAKLKAFNHKFLFN